MSKHDPISRPVSSITTFTDPYAGTRKRPPTPAVPRIAASLDDLRVGQVVAWLDALSNAHTGVVHRTMVTGGVTQVVVRLAEHDSYQFDSQVNTYTVVILSDPPPSPVEIPRALFDALHEAYGYLDRNRLNEAALAILQHVNGRLP